MNIRIVIRHRLSSTHLCILPPLFSTNNLHQTHCLTVYGVYALISSLIATCVPVNSTEAITLSLVNPDTIINGFDVSNTSAGHSLTIKP
jgi:hypothetical protein